MKRKYLIPGFCILLLLSCNKKEAEWIASTPDTQWQRQNRIESENSAKNMLVIEVDTNNPQQKIDGFGACFNEIGWDAIQLVDESKQQEILNSLFDKKFGLNFNFCRTSVAANDYSRDWYSYNETDGDFEMKNFSIERDKEAVIPYIKAAFNINPDIKLWASPWSVPTWMKTNKFYANKAGACNGLNKELEVPLYNDQVIQNPEYLQALALYFVKYLDAYKNEGINISMIMYQNEAFTFSEWPNGSWTPEGIANFNGKYLGPTMAKTHPDIDIFFGTLNTSDPVVYTTVLEDPEVRKYIKGIGVQWEGRDIFPSLKDKYPGLKLMQTESECGWGNFSWKDAEHTFNLMKHYFDGGANSYMCWNMVLQDDGSSSWCWKQNSLIRILSDTKEVIYTPEYFVYKHVCPFVTEGSVRLPVKKYFNNIPEENIDDKAIAFRTPDNEIIFIIGNYDDSEKQLSLKVGEDFYNLKMAPKSFNTIKI